MTSPLRVAVWCAVSSKPQAAQDKTSLKDQERAGRDFAAGISALVVRVYVVPGHSRDLVLWSEAEAAMPAYAQLRQDCQSHAFDVLFAIDADRLGRDPALSTQVYSLVERAGAEVYLASAPHPVGQATVGHRYVVAIQSVRAKEDQDLRTRRLMSGIRARVLRGLPASHWPTGYAPLYSPQTGHSIGADFDPQTLPALQLLTRAFLAGDSYNQILRTLDHSPHRPPRAPRWNYATTHHVLHSDFYAGFPSWGDVRYAGPEPSPYYPPLWDGPTFAAVRAERRRRVTHRYHRTTGSPLAGVAFCARCGGPMVRSKGSKGVTFLLRCSKHARKSRTREPCHPNYVQEPVVLQALVDFLLPLQDPAKLAAAVGQRADRVNPLRSQLDTIALRLRDVADRRHRLALVLAAGKMDPDVYADADTVLKRDLAALQSQRAQVQEQLSAAPDPEALRHALQEIFALLPQVAGTLPPELAPRVRRILQQAGVRVTVDHGKPTVSFT